MKINVNGKDIEFKEFIEALNNIWLIVNNRCPKCEKEQLNDTQKLELIRDIMVKRLNFKG